MIISYDYGHGTGQDRGANGIVNEETEIRKYGPIVINELMRKGHTLINCTPVSSNMGLNESLAYRVNKANASGSQLHICFHINAFQTTSKPMGSEIEVSSDAGQKYADSILKEIVKLGFINRGVKRPSLYVTKHTTMPCILIEPLFCDSAADVKIYNPNTLGSAIATGIINIIGGNSSAPVITKAASTVKIDQNILQLQEICIKLGVNDHFGNRVVADGIDGPNTQSAKAKLKSILNNILK